MGLNLVSFFPQLANQDQPEASGSGSRAVSKRGRSKLPKGRFMILEVDPTGEPCEPVSVLGPYKTAIGVLVRDFIPIKYRFWVGKDQHQEWVVPNSVKDNVWEKVTEKFAFPGDCDMKIVKKRTLQTMSTCFKNFKGDLNKHMKNEIEPDWQEYPKQQQY